MPTARWTSQLSTYSRHLCLPDCTMCNSKGKPPPSSSKFQQWYDYLSRCNESSPGRADWLTGGRTGGPFQQSSALPSSYAAQQPGLVPRASPTMDGTCSKDSYINAHQCNCSLPRLTPLPQRPLRRPSQHTSPASATPARPRPQHALLHLSLPRRTPGAVQRHRRSRRTWREAERRARLAPSGGRHPGSATAPAAGGRRQAGPQVRRGGPRGPGRRPVSLRCGGAPTDSLHLSQRESIYRRDSLSIAASLYLS